MVLQYHALESDDSLVKAFLMLPSILAQHYPALFLGISLAFLCVAFFLSWNYITAVLFLLLIINLNRIQFLMSNGGDSVVLMLAVWMIGMVDNPAKEERSRVVRYFIFNVAVLLCQVQVVLIYFVSGWDKVSSVVWRTGEAFAYIPHLDFMFNQGFTEFLSDSVTNAILSWMTIAFELTFVIAVWFGKTRLWVLAIGTVFHVMIAITLSIPDFAAVMIVSYLIFLKDSDYTRLRSHVTRFLP